MHKAGRNLKLNHGMLTICDVSYWSCLYHGNICSSHYLAITGAWAFTTSQTAKAHVILFQCIFKIASADTGLPIMFHHIHGTGFKTVIADIKGKVSVCTTDIFTLSIWITVIHDAGLGIYCMQLCHTITAQCIYESHHCICDLNPYDHLQHFFFVFVWHTTREIFSPCTHMFHRTFFLQC